MKTIKDAIIETSKLKVQGNNITHKANIQELLKEAMAIGQDLTTSISKLGSSQGTQNNTTPEATQPTVNTMAAQIVQLSKDMKEMKTLVSNTLESNTKTWAQVVGNENTTGNEGPPNQHRKLRAKRSEQIKEEAAKYSIKLLATNAPNEVKKRLAEMTHKDLIGQLQNAINKQYANNPPKLLPGMTKNDKDTYYRLQCKSPEEVQRLKSMNWGAAYEGLTEHKRKHGFVVHGVLKADLDPSTDNPDKAIEELEVENSSRNLHIVKLSTIKKKNPENPGIITRHHSVIIFTYSATEANECMERGVIIKGRFYSNIEKYAPQLNITQCYNCWGFGHVGAKCRKKQRCNNCGETEHTANECTNTTQCLGCGEGHPAWHRECKKWNEESTRLEQLRTTTLPHFIE